MSGMTWALVALAGATLLCGWQWHATRRALRMARFELRCESRRNNLVAAADRARAERTDAMVAAVLDPPPGGRDLPARTGLVLMPDGSFPLPQAEEVAAHTWSGAPRAPELDPRELIATGRVSAPGPVMDAVDVLIAHGGRRRRPKPPGIVDAFDWDTIGGEVLPEDPGRIGQAAQLLAELPPNPGPEPEPDPDPEPKSEDEPDPPDGGTVPVAAVARHKWGQPTKSTAGLPYVLPRDLMRYAAAVTVRVYRAPRLRVRLAGKAAAVAAAKTWLAEWWQANQPKPTTRGWEPGEATLVMTGEQPRMLPSARLAGRPGVHRRGRAVA